MSKYEVRRRRWPWPRQPLKRPWELIRVSDMKPVGFYETPEAAEDAKKFAEEAGELAIRTDLIKGIWPTGKMRGQKK